MTSLNNFLTSKMSIYTTLRPYILAHLGYRDISALRQASKKCNSLVNQDRPFALTLSKAIDVKEINHYGGINKFKSFLKCTNLVLNQEPIFNESFKLLDDIKKFPNLTSLDLSSKKEHLRPGKLLDSHSKLDKNILEMLKHVPHLTELNLQGFLRLETGIKHLQFVPKLEKLNISYVSSLESNDLKEIFQSCSNLQSLEANFCFSLQDQVSIPKLSQLKTLSFYGGGLISDIQFDEPTDLEELNLSFCRISNLDFLAKTPKLTQLFLRYVSSLPSEELLNISQLANTLTHLDLTLCKVTDAPLKEIAKCTKLVNLNLNSALKGDLSLIRNLTGLQKLDLRGNWNRDLTPLKSLSNLSVLYWPTGTIELEHLKALIPHWQKLKELDLFWSTVLHNHLPILAKLSQLEVLSFSNAFLPMTKYLKPLQELTSLRILKSNFVNISKIFEILPQLEEYKLQKERGFSVFQKKSLPQSTSRLLPYSSLLMEYRLLIRSICLYSTIAAIGIACFQFCQDTPNYTTSITIASIAVPLFIKFGYLANFHNWLIEKSYKPLPSES